MKVRLVETLVREGVAVLPNAESLAELFKAAGAAAEAGDVEFDAPKCIGKTVLEVTDDAGGLLVLQTQGQLLVTQAGRTAFADVNGGQPAPDAESTPAGQVGGSNGG